MGEVRGEQMQKGIISKWERSVGNVLLLVGIARAGPCPSLRCTLCLACSLTSNFDSSFKTVQGSLPVNFAEPLDRASAPLLYIYAARAYLSPMCSPT